MNSRRSDAVARKKVKILIAVWGGEYIKRFERFGLSSFLAKGNLPALARRCDVELVVLTCAGDDAHFEALPLMAEIRRHASVRYIMIDDLISPGHYSTTLTLAFTRGVAFFGAAMTSTWFVFWNADFVLSNGAFDHLADLIAADHKVIITGTLRAVSEQAEEILDSWRAGPEAPLAAPPRALVDLSFRYTHPHHVAKTVNQDACWTSMPSQMLWKVDAHTQLGRFFKAFMFCLQPTRVVTEINGPCDYTFVPEYCPGEPQYLIQDSDDAFILELQPRAAEAEFISIGEREEDERQACMNEWLTAEHLDTGRRVITLRSGASPPAKVAAAETGFQTYFDTFMEGVNPPSHHAGQYYWIYGCAAWRIHRNNHKPDQPKPVEFDNRITLDDLNHPTNDRRRAMAAKRMARAGKRKLAGLRRLLFGAPFRPARLHADAPATPLLEAEAERLKAELNGKPALILAAPGEWPDLAFPPTDPAWRSIEPEVALAWRLTGPPHAAGALVYVRPRRELGLRGEALYPTIDHSLLIDHVSGALAPGAPVTVLLHAAGYTGDEEWVDRQLRGLLSLHGRLDGFSIRIEEGAMRDLRYAAATDRFAGRARGGGLIGRLIALVRLALTFLGRLIGLGSRAPSGKPLLAVVTGRIPAAEDGLSA